MPKIAKSLKYRRSGVTYSVQLYDSVSEVGSTYMNLKVDGQTVYAKLGATGDSDASHLRVRKSGVTYAILNIARQELPTGFVAMFRGSCPDGWTQDTSFNGYFLRAAASYNATPQGAASHTHTFTPGTLETSNSTEKEYKIDLNNDCNFTGAGHSHGYTMPTATSSSKSVQPPHISVVFCKKD
jgi:hypothetical protein